MIRFYIWAPCKFNHPKFKKITNSTNAASGFTLFLLYRLKHVNHNHSITFHQMYRDLCTRFRLSHSPAKKTSCCLLYLMFLKDKCNANEFCLASLHSLSAVFSLRVLYGAAATSQHVCHVPLGAAGHPCVWRQW